MNRKEVYFVAILASFLIAGTGLFAQGHQDRKEGGESDLPEIRSSITVADGEEGQSELDGVRDRIIPLEQMLPKAEGYGETGNPLTSIGLEVQNGNVVYTAEFADSTMIILDAGNGDVLYRGKSLEEVNRSHYNEEKGWEDEDKEE